MTVACHILQCLCQSWFLYQLVHNKGSGKEHNWPVDGTLVYIFIYPICCLNYDLHLSNYQILHWMTLMSMILLLTQENLNELALITINWKWTIRKMLQEFFRPKCNRGSKKIGMALCLRIYLFKKIIYGLITQIRKSNDFLNFSRKIITLSKQ